MKIRTGFVSNSSSSSYVCDVCGEEACGYDISLRDAQMYQCENGHTFCEDHMIGEINMESLRAEAIKRLTSYGDISEGMDEDDRETAIEEYMEEISSERYDVSSLVCPCCTFQSSTAGEMLQFLLKEYGLTEDKVQNMMRERFKSFQEFKDFVR